MAVVINEFEVVPGESTPPAPEVQSPEGGGDKPPSEHEIGRLVAQRSVATNASGT